MSRISEVFDRRGGNNVPALVSFVTAGDPTLAHTLPALHALVAGGVDILELGVPFSDPEAEGPAIQRSSERALRNGVTLASVLDVVREFRKTDDRTPMVLMGYLNSILAMSDFAPRAQAAGVDALIMVNLPPEEASEIQAELQRHGIDLVYLLAPTTTDERAEYILSRASGFAYYVSLKGITGAQLLQTDEVASKMRTLRSLSSVPICVGFGIKDAKTAATVGAHADGVVVGSALVNLMAAGDPPVDGAAQEIGSPSSPEKVAQALQSAASELREGLDNIV